MAAAMVPRRPGSSNTRTTVAVMTGTSGRVITGDSLPTCGECSGTVMSKQGNVSSGWAAEGLPRMR